MVCTLYANNIMIYYIFVTATEKIARILISTKTHRKPAFPRFLTENGDLFLYHYGTFFSWQSKGEGPPTPMPRFIHTLYLPCMICLPTFGDFFYGTCR